MKRSRLADAPRSIVRLNVGGKLFQTTRDTLSGSVFFTSLLDHALEGDHDQDGTVFVDRDGDLFGEILNSLRTSRRPHQRAISLCKFQLLEECEFFGTDDVAARIRGHTCEADLSPYCRIIALEEKERRWCLIDVFQTPLRRKPVEELQLPPLLLSAARDRQLPPDGMLAGDHAHCKELLNIQLGGILLPLEQDPLVSSCCCIAGGAVVGALTGCNSGPSLRFCFFVPSSLLLRLV